ncbi:MAG: hypothetical protein ACU0CI_02530 [Shimia sp.]
MQFILAMYNTRCTASYERPARRGSPLQDWLIVQRPDAETLTIAEAGGAPLEPPATAPADLAARATRIGTLIARDTAAGTETFILNRHLPRGLVLPREEVFFPADGYATLSRDAGRPRLTVAGRHAHAHQIGGGHFIPIDISGEAADAASAFTWHFDAIHVPWTGEALPI